MSTTDPGLKQAVDYLIESDEPPEANVPAISNAAKAGDFGIEDIIKHYAEQKSRNGIVYPTDVSQLHELQKTVNADTDHSIGKLDDICDTVNLVKNEADINEQALRIYDADAPADKRRDAIKDLIADANRAGIDVDAEGVISSIKEFKSASEYTGGAVSGVRGDRDDLAKSISTPDEIQSESEYVYQIELEDGADIESVDWYIGGNKQGSGETIVHTFNFPGVYTISAEVSGTDGTTQHVTQEIDVIGAEEVDVEIIADEHVKVGEAATFSANVETKNVIVESLFWELDQTQFGEGKEITHTFPEPGKHTISVTAHTQSGLSAMDSAKVSVIEPTSADAEIVAPDTAYVGENITVNLTAETENTYIDGTTCTIDGKEVPVKSIPDNTFEYSFDEPGEHEISFTVISGGGDSAIVTDTIHTYVEPSVSFVNPVEEVTLGDKETFTANYNDQHSINWGVTNASLVAVNDDTATVKFDSDIENEASVTAEVENEIGDIVEDTVVVDINTPSVTAVIDGPEKQRVGGVGQFSAEKSNVEHASITGLRWETDDGTTIGTGENITYEFAEEGEVTIHLHIDTDRDISDTDSITVAVKPQTNVTAISVIDAGGTTEDTITLDASKSVAENVGIDSYTWEVGNATLQGEVVEFSPDRPGEYTVTLTVESEEGDTDTDTDTFEVKPFTDITAKLSGPESTTIGEEVTYNASDSSTVNTTVDAYEWHLNGKPAGEGKTFTQTFSTAGHYTLRLKVTSTTGDVDTDTVGITVEKAEPEITPRIITRDETVEGDVEFSAEQTTVKYGEPQSYTWIIDGEEFHTTDEKFHHSLDKIGPVDVELTVSARGDVKATAEETVYILPEPADPPIVVNQDDSKSDTLESISELYRDDRLPLQAKNWFAKQAVETASEYSTTIVEDEIAAYVDEHVDDVSGDDVDIDGTSENLVEPAEGPEQAVSADDDDTTSGWEVGAKGDESDDEGLLDEDSVSVETDSSDSDDGGVWEFDDGDDDASDDDGSLLEDEEVSTEETNTDDSESIAGDFFGSDEDEEDETEDSSEDEDELSVPEDELVDIEDPTSIADELVEKHREKRTPPEQYDIGGSVLSMPNYAQDIVDFEFVLEQDDETLQGDVNGAGIIVTDNDTYVAIARVEGRDWSIHTAEKRREIISTYQSAFLTGIENHVQIVSIPTRFDIRDHLDRVEAVLNEYQDDQDELLLNIGRSMYPNWMEGFMKQNDMRERAFYIVVPLSAKQLHEFKGGSESIAEQFSELPIVGGLFERFTEDRAEDITKYQVLRELNTRMERMENNLRRVDVSMERIDNRNEAMEVLFHYYHNDKPRSEVFPMGPFTTSEADATIGGVGIGELLEGESNTTEEGQQ